MFFCHIFPYPLEMPYRAPIDRRLTVQPCSGHGLARPCPQSRRRVSDEVSLYLLFLGTQGLYRVEKYGKKLSWGLQVQFYTEFKEQERQKAPEEN